MPQATSHEVAHNRDAYRLADDEADPRGEGPRVRLVCLEQMHHQSSSASTASSTESRGEVSSRGESVLLCQHAVPMRIALASDRQTLAALAAAGRED